MENEKLVAFKETISEALVGGYHTTVQEFKTELYRDVLIDHEEFNGNESLKWANKIIKQMKQKVKGMSENLPFAFYARRDDLGKKEARTLPKIARSNAHIIQHFLLDCFKLLQKEDKYFTVNDAFLYIFPLDSKEKRGFLLQVGEGGLTLSYKKHAYDDVDDLDKQARQAKLIRIPFGYMDM